MTDFPLSSISASGLVDGLGRRVLAFDRETGVMLERLVLRPELAAFEAAIKQRVDLLAAIDDERFARPGTVQRDRETGDLAVVSEFVAGSRLSDIIEAAEEAGLVPGVDVALGFLLEALPAISTFHNVTGFAHGLIEPSRMVITPGAGQVVFLDPSFGSVIERLGLSRHRLWAELGIAGAQSAGPLRLDPAADVSQLVLSALMLVIGRRLREHEYPDALPSLLNDVLEVAQIRGSNLFATSLDRLFQRSLPVPSRKPFGSADDLANEIRLLLRREIGVEACRQALLDFVEQMDAASEDHDAAAESHSGNGRRGFGLDDEVLDSMSFEVLDHGGDAESEDTFEEDSEEEEYSEVSLDSEQFGEPVTERQHLEPIAATDHASASAEHGSSSDELAASSETFDEFPALEPATEELSPASDVIGSDAEPAAEPGGDADASTFYEAEAPSSESAEAESNSVASRRRKRQNKSARARKDKLRSSAKPQPAPQPPPKPQPQPQAEQKSASGWLVAPDRAAAFAPPVPEALRPQPPAAAVPAPPIVVPPGAAPPMPQQPAAATPMPVPVAPPIARPVPMPVYTPVQTAAPPTIQPPAPTAPLPQIKQPAPAAGPVRLKNEPPAGYTPPRVSEPIAPMPYASAPRSVFQQPEEEPASRFPWKLAIAALVFVAIAVVAGRAYMLSGKDGESATASAAAPAPVDPAPVTPSKVETGDVTVETQPSGARVLLDGKPVGTSPLKLAGVPAGRHMLTFVTSSGEVTRTVKVAAGKTLEVDVSIFSGWLAVFAPVVLDISVNGKSIGSTEQSRLMIPPGRHELTLTSKDFGYKSVQEVTVEPGEVRSITIDPRGDANFNAIPWAEVWMDGQKLGDTPMANTRVPLGTREFVFKHPQYGERRITAIIRADQPTPVSVDFTKSQQP